LGFAFRKNAGQNVGWVECNETQQSLEKAQPNLQNAKWPRIEPTPTFEMKFHTKNLIDSAVYEKLQPAWVQTE